MDKNIIIALLIIMVVAQTLITIKVTNNITDMRAMAIERECASYNQETGGFEWSYIEK